jgi:hypothetical protein
VAFKITNESLWEKTNLVPVKAEINERKWNWIGHTLLKPPNKITRQSLNWNPQGTRKVGRPKQTWKRTFEIEAKTTG